MVDRAIAASPNGVEGLEMPSHLISLRDGQLDLSAVATAVKQQITELGRDADVSGVAAGLGLRWPTHTPLHLLSVPVTTSHCCTAGISLLRKLPQQHLSHKFARHLMTLCVYIYKCACFWMTASLQLPLRKCKYKRHNVLLTSSVSIP